MDRLGRPAGRAAPRRARARLRGGALGRRRARHRRPDRDVPDRPERPRRRDPRRVAWRPRPVPRRRRRACRGHRGAAGRRDGPGRDADRRAVPACRDGSLVVNELAPRVHNSGHWTIEGAATSQFEQHIRAICGLRARRRPMRSPPTAMVNLLGAGRRAPARLVRLGRRGARRSRPSTSTSTTSGRSSSAARWAT